MIRLSRFTVAAILLVPAAAIAQSAAVGILAAQSDNASLSATATEVRARVVELDRPARVLTLLGPDGSLHSIHVPASVKNLAQVGLGDELVVRHLVAQVSRLEPASVGGNAQRIETIKTAGSVPGGTPGFTEERTVEIIAKVLAVDTKARTATARCQTHGRRVCTEGLRYPTTEGERRLSCRLHRRHRRQCRARQLGKVVKSVSLA